MPATSRNARDGSPHVPTFCGVPFGAALVPLSQAVLLDINPREKVGQAMAIWRAGIMVGPILGPLLAGWLTETFDWRWVFFTNLLESGAQSERDNGSPFPPLADRAMSDFLAYAKKQPGVAFVRKDEIARWALEMPNVPSKAY